MDLSPLSSAIPSWGSPTLEGFDLSNAQTGQRVRGKSRQFVRFYNKEVVKMKTTQVRINQLTGTATPMAIEAVPEIQEWVEIVTPGDKNRIETKADEFHRREFWDQWIAFRDGKGVVIGTPIEECSFISPAIASELMYRGIKSLEQFADASDLLAGQIANGWELREYARTMVKTANDSKTSKEVVVLQDEIKTLKDQIALLVNAQGQKIVSSTSPVVESVDSNIESPEVKRRGRPKKIVEENNI